MRGLTAGTFRPARSFKYDIIHALTRTWHTYMTAPEERPWNKIHTRRHSSGPDGGPSLGSKTRNPQP